MTTLELWITVFGMGLVTFATRLSFILTSGKFEMPPLFRRALRYVPPAVLSAIILPELLRPGGAPVDASWHNVRWAAGIIAALVAWRTHNALITILVGMTILWGLQLIADLRGF